MSWREIELGSAIRVKHGYAFQGEHFSETGDFVVLTPGNFHEKGGFRIRPNKDRYYVGEIPESFVLHEGDLIVAMTEQGEGLLGSSAWIPAPGKYLHNQRLGLIEVIKPSALDKRFLYHLFNTRPVRGQIRASASGTKVRHTAPERICRVRALIPDVPTQQRIAEIIDNYDVLIDNNSRRIQLLEQSTRLLYKEWFVHLRFPGHEHVKVVGGVPKGWKRARFHEICETIGGGTPSTAVPEYWGGEITWVTPTDVTQNSSLYLLDSEKTITEAGLRNSSAKMLRPDAILMTSRASIGFFAVANRPVCTNQGFIAVVPRREHSRAFLLFHLMSRVEEFRARASGSTFKELSKGKFREMGLVWPSQSIRGEFEDHATAILGQIQALAIMNAKLVQARDLLLPRLMSGEIEV